MKTGTELIAQERQRQVEQTGWTAEYDDHHQSGQLAAAAACYAHLAVAVIQGETDMDEIKFNLLNFWPWDEHWFKPGADPVRNLAKAGALIAAEIDRLQRAQARLTNAAINDDGQPPSFLNRNRRVVLEKSTGTNTLNHENTLQPQAY